MEEASFAATQKEISKQAISNNKHLNKLSEIHKKKQKPRCCCRRKNFRSHSLDSVVVVVVVICRHHSASQPASKRASKGRVDYTADYISSFL